MTDVTTERVAGSLAGMSYKKQIQSIPHKNSRILVGTTAFGPQIYETNLTHIGRASVCTERSVNAKFVEPTTSQSLSAVTNQLMYAKSLLDSRFIQLGRVVLTSEGVFANPPLDANGDTVVDSVILNRLLDKTAPFNGVYLGAKDFGFAPYGTFKTGTQDVETFARGGLARILEHSHEKVAKNLLGLASRRNYSAGVNIVPATFEASSKPVANVAALASSLCGCTSLEVFSYNLGLHRPGFVFGKLQHNL